METFPALLAICAGNSPANGEFPLQGQWRGALMFSLIFAWIYGSEKNREAGDLRRHRAHYYAIVMHRNAIDHGLTVTERPNASSYRLTILYQ